MRVIGLVGEKGGGKGTFTDLLKQELATKKVDLHRFGDIISDILQILGKPKTRENMQKLPVALISAFGDPAVITRAMWPRIQKVQADIVVLDGIRTLADEQLLRSFEKNLLIYITASAETRFERARRRAEKLDEALMTFEEFLEQDQAEIERLIPSIGTRADYIIQNEQGLEEYRKKVKIVCTRLITSAE
jgi:uridine kinase